MLLGRNGSASEGETGTATAGELVAQLERVIDALLAVDPDTLSDTELHNTVIRVQAEPARLEAAKARLIAAWDARQIWADNGSRAASARLARDTRVSQREARVLVRRARKLRTMPATAAAFAAGELSVEHVDALCRANIPAVEALFARDEGVLVAEAKRLSVEALSRALRYWMLNADPDGERLHAERERQRRYCQLARTFGGAFDVRGFLDPISGTTVHAEHQRLLDELWEADMAEARTRLGRHQVSLDELARTPAQRSADALVVMAERSRACGRGDRRPAPLITVLVGYETLTDRLCELEDGTPLGPDQLLPLLGAGDIERIVFGGRSRVLDVGVRERFFTGALRRAIQVRDRHCQHPSGCDIPASRCHVDHIHPYTAGGPTTQDNGRLYCGPHNRARNKRPPPDDEA